MAMRARTKAPTAFVEGHQLGWRQITRAVAVGAQQDWLDSAGAEPFAFHRQKCELIQWVDKPQVRPEFKAIDNPRHGTQTDVLWAEIAMSFHDPPAVEPSQQEVFAAKYKPSTRLAT